MTARSIPFSPEPEVIEEQPFQGNARPIELSKKDISRFRSIVSAPIKGIAKGAVELGRLGYILMDPTAMLGKYADKGFDKLEEKIEKNIPTHPEILEEGLERSGNLGIGLLLGGGLGKAAGGAKQVAGKLGSVAGRAALGGAAGQAAEELGAPQWGQDIAEIGASSLPGLGRKIRPSSKDQERILEVGRRYGMSEEQLAPLMPEAKKKRFFGRYAFASDDAQDRIGSTRRATQGIYQHLENSPSAKKVLTPQEATRFTQDIDKLTRKMPHNIRSQIVHDAQDLANSVREHGGFRGDELINFYHDIGNRYHLDRAQLELLKGPIMNALSSLDPKLAHDFSVTNRMYQKAAQIGRILKPGQYEHLISLGEAYELGASVGTLDAGRLTRLLGVAGFRKFSEKMLTSPRLQNIVEKTQQALKANDLNALKKLGELLKKELQDDEDQE